MPTFTAMDLPADGNALKREDLYSDRNGGANGALYDPAQARTLEQMRGNLDKATNYSGADDSIEPWMVQSGALAVAQYWATDKWTFQYAKQLSKDNDGDGQAKLRIVHAELTKRLFLPWDAGTVLYGYQGWFRQDATWWDLAENPAVRDNPEFWDIRTKVRGVVNKSMYSRLPYGRDSGGLGPTAALGGTIGLHREDRWRWVSKTSMIKNVNKGYFPFEISVGCQIYSTDQLIAKTLTPSCGAWVIAFR